MVVATAACGALSGSNVAATAAAEFYALAFSPDSKQLVASWSDGQRHQLRFYDPRTGELTRSIRTPRLVEDIDYSSQGNLVATVQNMRASTFRIEIWDAMEGEVVAGRQVTNVSPLSYNRVAFLPLFSSLAIARANAPTLVWNYETSTRWPLQNGWFSIAAADGGRLLAYSRHRAIDVVRVENRRLISTIDGSRWGGGMPGPMAFGPPRLLAVIADDEVEIWQPIRNERLLRMHAGQFSVRSLAFQQRPARVAATTTEPAVHVWDARTGELLRKLKDEGIGRFEDVAVAPRSPLLAASKRSIFGGSIFVWNMNTGKLIRQIK